MPDRGQIEKTIRDAYAARVSGDAKKAAQYFTDDAEFRIAGEPTASPVAMKAVGAASVRDHLDKLIQAFEFSDHQILTMLVDGPRVAVHSRVTVRAKPKGPGGTTELMDLIEFRDGRIASFTQFCDTAFASRLSGM
jgi:ketosteroid isomerase-like protein